PAQVGIGTHAQGGQAGAGGDDDRRAWRGLNDVLKVLLRFAVVVAGYGAACLAASAFVYVLFLGWSGLARQEDLPGLNAGMVVAVPILALFIAHLNFWPAAIAIAVGEFLGK